jgi:hypothetical protein
MSLLSEIQHECVGAPTYLDVLPGDVLQFCLMPFLGWEDRIHVNMLTPAGDRTPPNKIDKERIIANQLLICSAKLTPRLLKAHKLQNAQWYGSRRISMIQIVEAILQVLQEMVKADNILLIQYSQTFRSKLEEKIVDFSDPNSMKAITRVYQREQMRKVLQQLTEKMASYPFIKSVEAKRFLSAPVTQNETALLNEWWVPGKGVVGRYLGDIYTQME